MCMGESETFTLKLLVFIIAMAIRDAKYADIHNDMRCRKMFLKGKTYHEI